MLVTNEGRLSNARVTVYQYYQSNQNKTKPYIYIYMFYLCISLFLPSLFGITHIAQWILSLRAGRPRAAQAVPCPLPCPLARLLLVAQPEMEIAHRASLPSTPKRSTSGWNDDRDRQRDRLRDGRDDRDQTGVYTCTVRLPQILVRKGSEITSVICLFFMFAYYISSPYFLNFENLEVWE